MDGLKCIGTEFYKIGTADNSFPRLINLEICEMDELMEWVLPFERTGILQIMPRLRKLGIWWAPKLKAAPAVWKLESLEELHIC
ncbi:hypothetical protein GIB67_027912 [Kingdonia uniflora]|uniref:Disease resistance protein n=1 Tax=Kingdonia uniflora TaxID=39325 RepID=A0A7J7LGU9_9MAGN|nr:hypothetical protein GIB67_027912 [Kingdonia uniflora]